MSAGKGYRILVINPGSTSTKLGMFEDETCLWEKTLHHSTTELEKFETIWDQYEFRKGEIVKFLIANGCNLAGLKAVVGRGGLLKPIESGTYRVDQRMINDLRLGVQGHHASNLGGVLAYGIGWDFGMPAFIVDPPAVDELVPISRVSGMADIPRISLFHALNIKATARRHASERGKSLENLNLIVAHLGGGITVAAIEKGRIIDVNEGISEGPFTPERSGSVPIMPLIEMCFSGKYSLAEIRRKVVGAGGLVSYLNTNSAKEVEALIRSGHGRARLVYEAMAYQIGKEIGSRAVGLAGKVDAILLTGGLARSEMLMGWIEERCSFLAPIHRYPGERELEALALGALRVLRGDETARIYDAREKTIGIVYSQFVQEYETAVTILETRLRDLGYRFRQKDENLELLIRNGDGRRKKMRNALEEFIAKKVDIIIALGSPAAAETKTFLKNLEIPLVCMACFDPVVMGLAEGYASPANKLTGTCYRVDVREQLKAGLLPLIPNVERLGIVYRSGEKQSEIQLDETREAGAALGIEVVPFDSQDAEKLDDAIPFFRGQGIDALFLGSDTAIATGTEGELRAIVTAFPTLCALESTIIKGGLVGHVATWETVCEDAVALAIKVLEGAAPSSLPIVRNPNPHTILNTRTLEALGLEPSEEFLATVTQRHR